VSARACVCVCPWRPRLHKKAPKKRRYFAGFSRRIPSDQ
jgi:hypothetical protein